MRPPDPDPPRGPAVGPALDAQRAGKAATGGEEVSVNVTSSTGERIRATSPLIYPPLIYRGNPTPLLGVGRGTDAVLFLQTIHDQLTSYNADHPAPISQLEFVERDALHESGHLFGLGHSESLPTIMDGEGAKILYMAKPSYGWFLPGQLDVIESVPMPGGWTRHF